MAQKYEQEERPRYKLGELQKRAIRALKSNERVEAFVPRLTYIFQCCMCPHFLTRVDVTLGVRGLQVLLAFVVPALISKNFATTDMIEWVLHKACLAWGAPGLQ